MAFLAFSLSKPLRIITIAFSIYVLLIVGSSADESFDQWVVGQLIRAGEQTSPPISDPTSSEPVLSKDVTINQSKNTRARIFLPHKVLDNAPPNKLPLIVFIHGGGFVAYSAFSKGVHDFLFRLAKATESVVISVDYRLAPEHRLPAAYDDSFEALQWIKASNDPWLMRYADYSRCCIMGESAGGNIAYSVGLRAAEEVDSLAPLKIQGLILIQPFFGGINRTSSELNIRNTYLLVEHTDVVWRVSLPVGADRDHVYSNPMVNGGSKSLDKIKRLGWKVAIFGCDGDVLVDKEKDVVDFFKSKGLDVEGYFDPKGKHGSFLNEPFMSTKVFDVAKTLHK